MTTKLASVLTLVLTVANARAADETALDAAIGAVIRATESSVVQLRYYGAGADTLGAAAAPVTGRLVSEGWVLTSLYGLADDPAGVLCITPDGRRQQAFLVGRDHSRRLALLRIEGAPATAPELPESRPARVGETVVVLGRAYALDTASVSVGVVSAVGRLGGRAIQIDALASPVNYGGPVVALDGTLLGVLAPLSPAGQNAVNLYDSGVGFAVPTTEIADRLATLADGIDIEAGWLGVSLPQDEPLHTPPRLLGVAEDGPANRAGLREGDVIRTIAGEPTPTLWRLRRLMSGLDAGRSVDATLSRDGAIVSAKILLDSKPAVTDEASAAEAEPPGENKQPDGP